MDKTIKGSLAFTRTRMIVASREDIFQSLQNDLTAIFSFVKELPRDEEQDTSTHRFVVQLPKKSPKEVAVRITADDEAGKIVLTPADPNVGSPFWIGFHLEPYLDHSTTIKAEVILAPKFVVRWGFKKTLKGEVNKFMDGLLRELAAHMRDD